VTVTSFADDTSPEKPEEEKQPEKKKEEPKKTAKAEKSEGVRATAKSD
jgi:hypothetical protein